MMRSWKTGSETQDRRLDFLLFPFGLLGLAVAVATKETGSQF